VKDLSQRAVFRTRAIPVAGNSRCSSKSQGGPQAVILCGAFSATDSGKNRSPLILGLGRSGKRRTRPIARNPRRDFRDSASIQNMGVLVRFTCG